MIDFPSEMVELDQCKQTNVGDKLSFRELFSLSGNVRAMNTAEKLDYFCQSNKLVV